MTKTFDDKYTPRRVEYLARTLSFITLTLNISAIDRLPRKRSDKSWIEIDPTLLPRHVSSGNIVSRAN